VILGGVAASQGIVPLWAVIVAAVSGAIIGDSIGYLIGRRWGTHLLYGTVGRLPVIRGQLDKHLGSAQAYVRLRKGRAVFFGRFTAALRVLVPGLAGLSKVPYPSFLATLGLSRLSRPRIVGAIGHDPPACCLASPISSCASLLTSCSSAPAPMRSSAPRCSPSAIRGGHQAARRACRLCARARGAARSSYRVQNLQRLLVEDQRR